MSARSLAVLATILAAVALLALTVGRGDRGAPADQPFLPQLEARLNEVDRVTLTGAGNETLASLVVKKSRWVVAERDGYAADIGKLRSNLVALARARILEQKTANPDYHGRLGVEDIAGEEATGVLVTLHAGEERLAAVIIGETGVGGGGQAYARRAGENQAWLIGGDFDFGNNADDWVESTVLDIPAERIASVEISHPDDETVRVTRDGETLRLDTLPDGRELSYPAALDMLAGALARLTADEVRGADRVDGDRAGAIKGSFVTADGLRIDLFTVEAGDDQWTIFQAKPDMPPPAGDAADGEAAAYNALRDEAAAINRQLWGYAFRLPAWKVAELTRRNADLLKPLDSE